MIKTSWGRQAAYLAFSHFSGLKQITKGSDEHQGWWPNPSGRNAAQREEEKQGVPPSVARAVKSLPTSCETSPYSTPCCRPSSPAPARSRRGRHYPLLSPSPQTHTAPICHRKEEAQGNAGCPVLKWGQTGSQRGGRTLTLAGVVEMVVILRHVSHDAEAVGDFHGDHVIGI